MEVQTEGPRTRINLSQNAKGTWQIDATAEYATPEESLANLTKAIDGAQKIITDRGLVPA